MTGFLLVFLILIGILMLKYAHMCDELVAENNRLQEIIDDFDDPQSKGKSWTN